MAERKQNPILKDKLSALKQKQDNWLKERSRSINNSKINQPNITPSKHTKIPKAAVNGTVKKTPDTLLWNTGAKSTPYNGFVVRRKDSGMETDRSQRSSRSHSSLRRTERPSSSIGSKSTQPSKVNTSKQNRHSTPDTSELTHYSTPKLNNSSEDTNEVADETLSIKLNDYFSKLDVNDKGPLHSLHTSFYDQTGRAHKRTAMSNHTCQLCHQVMNSQNCVPQIVYPCAHSFCSMCLSGQKYCPDCNCNIISVEENSTLLKVIQQFHEHQQQQLKAQRENEAKKYVSEYKSLVTRAKVMKDEASGIIDRMESFTHEIVMRKNNLVDIQKNASNIKEKMKSLQENLHVLEKQHISEIDRIEKLEEEYENYKKQLIMTEKTLKTIGQSKERVKVLVENIAPSISLEDDDD